MKVLRFVSVAFLVAACGASATPRPEDMSAAAHRREAARERQLAGRAAAGHAAADRELSFPANGDDPAFGLPSLESGRRDLAIARARAEHARQHEGAAAALEASEAAECAEVPPGERAACPLLVGAGVILDIPGGVEVRFHAGAPVDDVYRRMRCHLAFARARGFALAGDCPLYVKGLRLEREGPRVLRILGGRASDVEDLRRRARALAVPDRPTT